MMGNEDQWYYVFSKDFSVINFLSVFLADIKAPSNSEFMSLDWYHCISHLTCFAVQFNTSLSLTI